MIAGHRPFLRRDPAGLERLRARVRTLERSGVGLGGSLRDGVVRLGVAEIDGQLPWGGLPRGALHELFAAHPGAATGFCAALCARLAKDKDGAVLWCEGRRTLDAGELYAPGLIRYGLDPARMIAVRTRRDADALWAIEEALRCDRVAVVAGEVGEISLTQSRRLQLAAETSGVTALVLRPREESPAPSAAVTRWRLDVAPGYPDDGRPREPGLGPVRWRAELFRCRGGGDGLEWEMEWHDEAGGFAVAAPVRDRSAMPRPARLAG